MIKHKEHKAHKVLLGALCALCVLSPPAPALADSVENVRYSVTADNRIVIYYDLIGAGEYAVSVSVSTDGGATFSVKPKTLTGDVGTNVAAGRDKQITWNVLKDLPRLQGDVAVEVAALSAAGGASLQGPVAGMTFVRIPVGSFMMGSPYDEDGRYYDEGPRQRVTTQPFYIMTTEITQAQWIALMGSNPSHFKGDNLPVEEVSWNDAQKFIHKLNQRDPGKGYRLPSEAEWEYACRAGTTTRFYTGNSEQDLARAGWYYGNSGSNTHPVAQKTPNAWGLYDMHGNVWEWCQDWYHDTYMGAPTHGRAWESPSGDYHVLRGGSRYDKPSKCRSAARRLGDEPYFRSSNFGFRLVRSP